MDSGIERNVEFALHANRADTWTSGLDPAFIKAAAECALTNNETTAENLATYFRTALRLVDRNTHKKLSKSLIDGAECSPRVVVVGGNVSLAPMPMHFVYMDVGCWAGDGKKKNGWTRHREFGVVHGGLAILCSFEDEPEGHRALLKPPRWTDFAASPARTPMIDPTVIRHPSWPRVQSFLDQLAGLVDPDIQGHLYLLGATMVAWTLMPTPPGGENDPILVFIGDLHAPVATGSSNAHIVENGKEMLRGRLETMKAKPERLFFDVQGRIYDEAARLGREASDIVSERRWDSVTTHESVENWLRIYRGEGRRGADIFQGAGGDLKVFVDQLKEIHRTTSPLYVVQLGDMFDLWLGFQRGFSASIGNMLPHARRFARLWVKRTLFDTDQGPYLRDFLTMSKSAGINLRTGLPLQTKFLYGNHDNYRKHRLEQEHRVEGPWSDDEKGLETSVFEAPASLELPGLWAEHGHQPDPSNRDENPVRGHRLTQAAYLEPGVRSWEGRATWASWKVGSGGLARVEGIMHAMKRCLLDHLDHGSPCRGIYVMGHTHEAMLKRVELLPWAPSKK